MEYFGLDSLISLEELQARVRNTIWSELPAARDPILRMEEYHREADLHILNFDYVLEIMSEVFHPATESGMEKSLQPSFARVSACLKWAAAC
jgi:hypothetical protein